MLSHRYLFVDWMKVLGMYFIILGHLFPVHDEYIYAFNVPLFFILSGVLTNIEENWPVFWSKIYSNLILPLVLICVVNAIFDFCVLYHRGELTYSHFYMRALSCLIGNGGGEYGGLRSCWFIYTLILIKIVYQQFSSLWQTAIIAILSIGVTLYLNKEIEEGLRNSYANFFISMPFFILGTYFKKHIDRFENPKILNYVFFTIISLILFGVCVPYNGEVWMYMTLYGNSYVLFFLGALSGTGLIYAVSVLLQKNLNRFITTLSTGMIIILGFHQIFLFFFKYFNTYNYIAQVIYSLFVLVCFYPVILITMRYCPVFIGKRHVKK